MDFSIVLKMKRFTESLKKQAKSRNHLQNAYNLLETQVKNKTTVWLDPPTLHIILNELTLAGMFKPLPMILDESKIQP